MSKSSTLFGVLAGLGAGAVTMYFFDPDRGSRRRAIAGDKFKRSARHLSRTISNTRKDLANRGYGLWIETKHFLSPGDAPDPVIEERVRSKMGRIVSYPHGIKVTADGGKIKLSGMVLADELPALIRGVKSVAGVSAVEHNLATYAASGGVSTAGGKSSTAQELTPVRGQIVH